MLGTAATVDDGDPDPGTLRVSHKLERLQPNRDEHSVRVQRPSDIGHQIVSVLDTRRDAGKAFRHLIAPACAAVDRGMDTAETGRRDQQFTAPHQRMHGFGHYGPMDPSLGGGVGGGVMLGDDHKVLNSWGLCATGFAKDLDDFGGFAWRRWR